MAKKPAPRSSVNAAQTRAIKQLREEIAQLKSASARSRSTDRRHDDEIDKLVAELDRIVASRASKSSTDRAQTRDINALKAAIEQVANAMRAQSQTDFDQDTLIYDLSEKVERMSSIVDGLAGLGTVDNILTNGFHNLIAQLRPLRDLTPIRRPFDDGERDGCHPQRDRLSKLRNSLEPPVWASAGSLGIIEHRVPFFFEAHDCGKPKNPDGNVSESPPSGEPESSERDFFFQREA